MPRLTPVQKKIAIGVAVILLTVLLAVLLFGRGDVARDQLNGNEVSAADGRAPVDAAAACASPRTYDEIRRELFRKAAALRGRDEAVFDQIARNAMLSVDRPRLVARNESIGQLRCAGTLTVALPPGLATGSGQSRLRGDAEYGVQQAADGSGVAVTLIGGDALTASLATLVRSAAPRQPTAAPAPPPPVQTAPPPPAERPPADPSFDCAYARTRSERAVCANSELAALDRQMAARYVAAMRDADPREVRELQFSRNRFLRYRDRCDSDRCIADAYRERMAEIGDILDGDWRP